MADAAEAEKRAEGQLTRRYWKFVEGISLALVLLGTATAEASALTVRILGPEHFTETSRASLSNIFMQYGCCHAPHGQSVHACTRRGVSRDGVPHSSTGGLQYDNHTNTMTRTNPVKLPRAPPPLTPTHQPQHHELGRSRRVVAFAGLRASPHV